MAEATFLELDALYLRFLTIELKIQPKARRRRTGPTEHERGEQESHVILSMLPLPHRKATVPVCTLCLQHPRALSRRKY